MVRRRTAPTVAAALSVALTVCVIGSLAVFFAASRARMTERAAAGVPVDWQVLLSKGADPAEARRAVASAPGARDVLTVAYADTTGLQASAGGGRQTTGPGVVLGLPPGYGRAFPGEIRALVGATEGVLLAQQTAANLHATLGSTIEIGRPGLASVRLAVAGIVDLPEADSLFQAIGVAPSTAPAAPPDNVVLLPDATWHLMFDPVARARPDAVRTQLHVALSRALPADPGAAFADVIARAKNLEARLAGAGVVGDNLAVRLDAARADALYAELLFLFLGLPAAVLAALVAATVWAAGAERRRREQALLRIRGAAPRRIVGVAAVEALAVGAAGSAIGIGAAVLAGRLAFSSVRFGATGGETAVWLGVAAATGLGVSMLSILLPAWRDARRLSVAEARKTIGSVERPLWMRGYADLILLAGAGLVFWRVVRSGYQVVLAPEGIATISVNYASVLAPLLLWTGAALFAWRLSSGTLRRARRALARAIRPVAGGLAGVVAAWMSRQRRLLSRSLVLMALAASFAASTAMFNATYEAQARVDAELTNGADVAVTTAGAALPPGTLDRIRRTPGVADAEPMQHRFAYVGNDLQDLYGIDPGAIGRATVMSDAFFAGGHARDVLAALARRPDAILVSEETVHDFQLRPGDLVRLRLQFPSDRAYHVVEFHYAGVAREFPTAPRDSFLVANASYVARATGTDAFQTILARTSGSPPDVADRIRSLLGPASGAEVRDVVSQLRVTLSGLTAIDLRGLTRLELTYAVLLGVAASGLVLGLGLAERRRTFAIAAALGARARQLAAFVWSEAAFVAAGGLVLGALTGWGLAAVVVKMLTGVFDPPPEHLSVPFAYLAVVGGAIVAAIVLACTGALRSMRRPAIETLRDL